MKTTSLQVKGVFAKAYAPSTPGAVAHGISATIIGGVDHGATVGCRAVARAAKAIGQTFSAGFAALFGSPEPAIVAGPRNRRRNSRR